MSVYPTSGGSSSDENLDVYRVMIVDDSTVIRGAIARALEADPAITILSSVSNGEMAIATLKRESVDVVVLDIEMPVMDGLTALPKLKEVDSAVQIIMSSTLTQRNAEISLRAMSLGATDYIAKPSSARDLLGADGFNRELTEKVKALGALARRTGVRLPPGGPPRRAAALAGLAKPKPVAAAPAVSSALQKAVTPAPQSAPASPSAAAPQKKSLSLRSDPIMKPDVIAIGSSTGGPQALFRVIKDMGAGLSQPVVITQHMPASFTAILAEHITKQCGVKCSEAKEGDQLEGGKFYVAPGDYHMLIEQRGGVYKVKLVKDPPENFCRPSVDPMLRSLVASYGKRILTVILTGMGQDGLKGGEAVVKSGGAVIAQDEATSVVWGMPGAVAMAGICSAILPINDIGAFVRQTATRLRA